MAYQEPIACTLDPAGFATQSERWTRVFAGAAIDTVGTEDGVRVRFRAESGVEEELRELVAVESACCSWANWRVEVGDDQIVLRITSAGDGPAVIHNMFATQPSR